MEFTIFTAVLVPWFILRKQYFQVRTCFKERILCLPQKGLYGDPSVVIGIKLFHDTSVSIATGYGLDCRGLGVRFGVVAGNFSLLHRVQNGSGAHPASYPTGTGNSFPGGKPSGAWS
jgi:hypothetical protein